MSDVKKIFNGKVVWVTGSSRGIGAAVAKTFALKGAQVVLHYVSREDQAKAVAEEITKSGGAEPLCVRADLSQEDDIKSIVATIKSKFGTLNVVVNNAGISVDGLLPRFKIEDMDRMWQVNLRSAILVSKHCFPLLRRADQPSIINMSSVVGLTGNAGQSIYAATKAGLIAVTKSLAKEFASRNIRVNAIAPGFIDTDMTDTLPEDTQKKYLAHIPLGRFGQPAEVS